MKTEAEIRLLIVAYGRARRQPCDCKGGPHEHECIAGGEMMSAAATALQWVLGERADDEVFPELIAERAVQREQAELN